MDQVCCLDMAVPGGIRGPGLTESNSSSQPHSPARQFNCTDDMNVSTVYTFNTGIHTVIRIVLFLHMSRLVLFSAQR